MNKHAGYQSSDKLRRRIYWATRLDAETEYIQAYTPRLQLEWRPSLREQTREEELTESKELRGENEREVKEVRKGCRMLRRVLMTTYTILLPRVSQLKE